MTQKPVRVAFYMHDFAGGGVERMRLRLFAALSKKNVDITAIVHARRGALLNQLPEEVKVIGLGTRRTLADILPLFRILRSGRFDIVISNLDHNNVVLLVAKLLSGRKTRVIISQHNCLRSEAAANWRYRLVPVLYRALWRQADAVFAVSNGVADDLVNLTGMPRNAVRVVTNPVVGGDFRSRCDHPPPHPWLAERSCPTFVFVGRLTTQKDPETLIAAMAWRLRHGPARLILLGDGELAGPLADLAASLNISNAICFVGYQQEPLPWIKFASALVLSSRYEGLGNVIVEALACGTPVISTACPFGPAEILLGGKLGVLVPPGSPAELGKALLPGFEDVCSADERRRRAAHFSEQACVTSHLRVFDAITQSARRSPIRVFGLALSNESLRECVDKIMCCKAAAGFECS